MKRALALAAAILLAPLLQAYPPPPNPGDQILLIYTNDPYNVVMANNVKAALTGGGSLLPLAERPAITDLVIPSGDWDGIADQIAGDPNAYLAGFCQVWDLRFVADNGIPTGQIRSDSITSGTPTSDSALFQNFLAQGGHLYLQAENEGFRARNEGVVQFIGDVTGAPITYPGANATWSVPTLSNAAPHFFRTATAASTLTAPLALDTWPGRVPLAGAGNGTPLCYDATYTLDLLHGPAQLLPGNGRMMTTFDSNLLHDMSAQWDRYIVNAYVTLANCYNFTITKAVNDSEVCAGDPVVFTLCYRNTGTNSIPNVTVYDTLPNCVVFSSSSPNPPSGNTGSYYWWDLGNLPPGPQQCITINVVTTICP